MKKLLLLAIAFSALLNGENAPFDMGIDYLFWETKQDDMDYGFISTSQTTSLNEDLSGLPVNSNTLNAANTKIIRSNFKYESGFRAWVGYTLPCTDFNCNVVYTYLPNTVKTTTLRLSTETILSFFTSLPLSSLEAKWSSFFNQIDIDFGNKINLGSLLELNPHLGLRGVFIKQYFYLRSNFISTVSVDISPTASTNASYNRLNQNFNGIGIEGGLRAAINLGYGVSLIGHCGGALLYSEFKVKNEYETAFVNDETSTPTSLSYEQDNICTSTPVFDYFIGLNYNSPFCENLLSLHVGWEQHLFFDMNRLQLGGYEFGNFSTTGLTVGIDLMF